MKILEQAIVIFIVIFITYMNPVSVYATSCRSILKRDRFELIHAEGLLRDYTRSAYLEINKEIRENPESEESQRYIKMLNLALDQIPNFEGYVYRGIKHDERSESWVDSLKKGDIFSWSTPISTSSRQGIGRVFGPIVFTIKAKTAKDLQDYALYSGIGINENEYLLRPGTNFRVVSVIAPYPGKINREVFVEEL